MTLDPEEATRLCIEALAAKCVASHDGSGGHCPDYTAMRALESGDLRIVLKPNQECYCEPGGMDEVVTTDTNTAYAKCEEHGNILEFVYPGTWAVIADQSHAYAVARLLKQQRRLAALEKVAEEARVDSEGIHKFGYIYDDLAVDEALAELDALDGGDAK